MDQRGGGGNFGKQKGPDIPVKLSSVSIIAGIGVVALIAVVIITNSFTIVDAGTRGVVKTFGEVTGVFQEGLHFRTPFVTSVTIVDVKTQRFESNSTSASRDLQDVTTAVVLNYRADPSAAGDLIRDIGADYENIIIEPAVQESVKAATAQFNAEELITQRPQVSEEIQQVLETRLEPRGITVQEVSITEFSFQPDFAQAVEQKQVAEQDALRAQLELERARTQAQQRVAEAEADAEARVARAQAEATALSVQRDALSSELLQLRYIEKWDGILPRFIGGGDSGLMPLITLSEDDVAGNTAPERTPTPGPVESNQDETETPTAEPTSTPVPTPTVSP